MDEGHGFAMVICTGLSKVEVARRNPQQQEIIQEDRENPLSCLFSLFFDPDDMSGIITYLEAILVILDPFLFSRTLKPMRTPIMRPNEWDV